MPNWCYTGYAIEATPEQIKSFEKTLNKLCNLERPLLENGFGKLWMGVIVHLLGKDWHTIYCRGQIIDYHVADDRCLRLNVESAWSELSEVRQLFLQKFPESDVYYQSEESGMEIYDTNDSAGKYFSARYIVDSEQSGVEYFDTIEEAATYVQDLTGYETEATSEGVLKSVAGWIEEDPKTRWMGFHEFNVVE